MLYVPTVMLYFVGVSVYVLGPGHQGLPDNKLFAACVSLTLLALLTVLNILGLGVGKWINNVGALGNLHRRSGASWLGIVIWSWRRRHRSRFQNSRQPPLRSQFFWRDLLRPCRSGTRLVMGDEIQDPRRTLPGAVALGGLVSGMLYVAATLTLRVAVGKSVNVLQGVVQAVTGMAARVGVNWISIPFALMLSLAIAGIGSAWIGGCSRIPFVAGLDSYMPSWLGKVHPRYATRPDHYYCRFLLERDPRPGPAGSHQRANG